MAKLIRSFSVEQRIAAEEVFKNNNNVHVIRAGFLVKQNTSNNKHSCRYVRCRKRGQRLNPSTSAADATARSNTNRDTNIVLMFRATVHLKKNCRLQMGCIDE